MAATSTDNELQTFLITQDIHIAAPVSIAWESLLEELGPENTTPYGPMPMTLEARPGGRWFRDLGNHAGHLWGHVQVIKPPALLELSGPMFMSYACANHIQYRLTADGTGTKVTLTHRALGQIPQEHREGVVEGWKYGLNRIRELAERRV